MYGTAFHIRPDSIVPSAYPVINVTAETDALAASVATAREFVGLDAADDSRDTELTAFIKAATRQVEQFCQLAILNTTFVANYPYFTERLPLPKRPYASTTGIEHVQATDGEITTTSAALYHVIESGQDTAIVYLGKGLAWPTDVAERHDAVRVTFVAGYGTTEADVPADIKHAILMTVAALDSKRGDDCGGAGGASSVYAMKNSSPSIIPSAAQAMLAPYCYRFLTVA